VAESGLVLAESGLVLAESGLVLAGEVVEVVAGASDTYRGVYGNYLKGVSVG
jgi:hypothetical protein